jgi:hypothetical protein
MTSATSDAPGQCPVPHSPPRTTGARHLARCVRTIPCPDHRVGETFVTDEPNPAGQPLPGWSNQPPPSWTAPGTGPGWAQPSQQPQYSYGSSGWLAPPQAPKPGIVALRPLGLSDILDGAVSYVRRDPKTVLGISAVLSLILMLATFATNSLLYSTFSRIAGDSTSAGSASSSVFSSSNDPSLTSGLTTLLAYPITVLIGLVATGLLTVVVGQAVLGRRVTVGEAWRAARPRLWSLLGVTVLTGVIVAGVTAVGLGLAIGAGALLWQANAAVGVLVGVVIVIGVLLLVLWIGIRLLLAPVVVVLEGAGPITALHRSARLVGGSWWRIFGIYLLARILIGIVAGILSIPFAIAGALLLGLTDTSGNFDHPWWYFAVTGLSTFVGSLFTMPFIAGVIALQYIDLRIRREALDLDLARAAGLG